MAAPAVALLHPNAGPRPDDLALAIAEHGSIAAIDHHDQQRIALRTAMSAAVAEHGSVAAIDHRDLVRRTNTD
jgi:hypothetical protein